MEQGARSSVVNGPFTGTKERRSFKPKVASSILVGRMEEAQSRAGFVRKVRLLCCRVNAGQPRSAGRKGAFFRPLLPLHLPFGTTIAARHGYCPGLWAPTTWRILDHVLGAMLQVEFATEGRQVTDYAVVLPFEAGEAIETIRVYDGAHGHKRDAPIYPQRREAGGDAVSQRYPWRSSSTPIRPRRAMRFSEPLTKAVRLSWSPPMAAAGF
jgi:hypothetical protein